MKKGFTYYIIIWVAALALFNLISFVTPAVQNGVSKFEGGFWPGYVGIMLAFALQLATGVDAFRYADKWERGTKTGCLIVSVVELCLVTIIGAVCMLAPKVKDWAAVIAMAVAVVLSLVIYLIIRGTSEHAARVNRR